MGYAAISRQIVSGLSLIVGHPADVVELLDVWKTHTFGVRSEVVLYTKSSLNVIDKFLETVT